MELTFVVAANDRATLSTNLLASPCLRQHCCHELLVQEGYKSAAAAYNEALDRADHEIVVLVHQDVFLPEDWVPQLEAALKALAVSDPTWGVLGCWGVTEAGAGKGHVYTPGEGIVGQSFRKPEPVQTLDELLLVIRKPSPIRFNEKLPGFHFYGTDICMSAATMGLRSYAISAFCVHNARQYLAFPDDFYASYRVIKRIWKHRLPINTSCIRISRFDRDLRVRRAKEAYWKLTSISPERLPRSQDPKTILEHLGY